MLCEGGSARCNFAVQEERKQTYSFHLQILRNRMYRNCWKKRKVEKLHYFGALKKKKLNDSEVTQTN